MYPSLRRKPCGPSWEFPALRSWARACPWASKCSRRPSLRNTTTCWRSSADGSVNVVDLRDAPVARAIEGARGCLAHRAEPRGRQGSTARRRVLQMIAGLPAQPAVAATVEAGDAGAFAVSDDGTLLFESGGTLFAVAPGGEAPPVPFAGQASLIAFLEGTRDALVAGRDDNQVALVRDVTGTPAYRRLAGASEGIDPPVGLAFANGRALVASGNSVVATSTWRAARPQPPPAAARCPASSACAARRSTARATWAPARYGCSTERRIVSCSFPRRLRRWSNEGPGCSPAGGGGVVGPDLLLPAR